MNAFKKSASSKEVSAIKGFLRLLTGVSGLGFATEPVCRGLVWPATLKLAHPKRDKKMPAFPKFALCFRMPSSIQLVVLCLHL